MKLTPEVRARRIVTYRRARCHICGLPIPIETVNNITHPLTGTQDHLIPRSMGGEDSPENIKPAHKFCNNARGTQDVTHGLRIRTRIVIIGYFGRMKLPPSKRFKQVRVMVSKQKGTYGKRKENAGS